MANPLEDLRRKREEWKQKALYGSYTPEEIHHLNYVADAERERQKKEPKENAPLIPQELRYEGVYICGRPGSGKTQLIQHLLQSDLDMVAAGKASLIVIDPTGDFGGGKPSLINVLTRLKRFAPGGDLHGKLVYVDPLLEDHYYLPVNLFSGRPIEPTARAVSAIISSYVQIMDGLLGQPLTGYQSPVFKWAVQVALAFPNPTLETLIDILTPTADGERHAYEDVFDNLEPAIQRYLRRNYQTYGRIAAREQIVSRLESLNADPLFRQMFNGERTSLNFNTLINQPCVTVINLKPELGEMRKLYARYFMAQLYQAGDRRREDPLPCYIYIDECDLIVDASVGEMLRRLRKKEVGLTFANQETWIIPEEANEAITGVAVKFINARAKSARELGQNMDLQDGAGRVDVSSLVNRPRFNFAYHVVAMDEPTTYTFKPFTMNQQPAMTEVEWAGVLKKIRDDFYEPVPLSRPNEAVSAPPQKPTPSRRSQGRPYPPQVQSKATPAAPAVPPTRRRDREYK